MQGVRKTSHKKGCSSGGEWQGKKSPTTCNMEVEKTDISQFRDCYEVYGENCPICRRWVR